MPRKHSYLEIAALATLLTVGLGSLPSSAQSEFFSNNGFETGDHTGWIIIGSATVGTAGDCGSFCSWDSICTSGPDNFFRTAPVEGSYSSVDGFGAYGFVERCQEVSIPAGTTNLQLSWNHRLAWDNCTFRSGQRTVNVTVQPTGGGSALRTEQVFLAPIDGVTPDSGNMVFVSSDLSTFAGSTYRFCITEIGGGGPGHSEVDDVHLTGDLPDGTATCGDDILTPPEECDDGNNVDGDGCNANCGNEFCGDGIVQAGLGEECDDGGNVDGDGCNANCRNEFCGDGITTPPEECDDGGNVDGDGCNANCGNEFCGDGITTPPEGCDDANLNDGDGCNSSCVSEGACCVGRGPNTPVECLVTTEQGCLDVAGLYRGDGTGCGAGAEATCYALEVTMESMSARETPDGVLIQWSTAKETDTVGFRILRETATDADHTQKSVQAVSSMIPAAGHGLTGASYQFLDNSKLASTAERYWIEDVDFYGRVTRHGPIAVEAAEQTTVKPVTATKGR